jgi:hypothetical protein
MIAPFLTKGLSPMRWYEKLSLALIAIITFIIPIEHKYDKPLRKFSYTCVPEGLFLPPGFDLKIYFYPSDVIAFCVFLCLLFAYKIAPRKLFLEKGMVFLWILFACAVFSIVSSPLLYYPTIYTRLIQLLTPIFIASYLLHTPSSEQRLKLFFSLFITAALIQSGIAICQYFSQQYLGLRLLSEPRDAPATFEIASGRRWILDILSHNPVMTTTIKRSPGTFPHCNALGGFLTFTILSSYSYIASAKNIWHRYWLGLLLIPQFFGLATTYSRSAIFALIIGTTIWLIWAVRTGQRYRFLASMIAVSSVLSFGLLGEQYLERGGIFNYNQTVKASDQIRIAAQETAFQIIQDHPITGVGFQQFSRGATAYGNPTGAHNIYLFLTSEMGLLACLSFLAFIGFALITAIRIPFTPQIASLFASLIAFLFIGACDFYPILFQQGKLILFLITALLLSEALRIKNLQRTEKTCLT